MSAPRFVPVPPADRPRTYESPDHIPDHWTQNRPAEVVRQPKAPQLGYQGPDQGYALLLAERFRDRVRLQAGEEADDAINGCLGIALRRASLFGRAPTIHDLTIAFTIWGFLDASPDAALVTRRKALFEGVRSTDHHYREGRAIADAVPEATLRMSHQQVQAAYPASWRELIGA
jgi:hypothetical protein